jgi:DNA-binding GntR family transcriptional regulator
VPEDELIDEDVEAPGGIESSSLVDLAVERLRREILGGAFLPGDRIVEQQVTARFGISRGPLREALRLLAQQGLIEHVPRRGVRVATLSDRDVRELFELRDVLERHAVEAALPVAEDRLAGLRRELTAMNHAAEAGDELREADAHRRFHAELVALADQRQLLLAYQPILLRLQLHMATNLRREAQAATPMDGIRRHRILMDAVVAGSPDAVLRALAAHGAQAYLH